MATIADVEQLILKHADVCHAGDPAPDLLIEKAERFLGVRFPDDYREFLRRWGTLAVGPLEVYGVTGDEFERSSAPNAIWYTHVQRQRVNLPHAMIVICDHDGDAYSCLDTADAQPGRVVVWDVMSREVASVRAASIFDFILEESEGIV